MQYVKLGNTGLDVSPLCLGCMSYGSPHWQGWVLEMDQAKEHFKIALDAGINFFDTADVYSWGRSEEITGSILGDMTSRSSVVLATKVFFPNRKPDDPKDQTPNSMGLSRKRILDACDLSLKRLGVDYIDLYQIHRFDPRTPLEETLRALNDLVDSGRVRYLGASSMAAWQFTKALYMAGERGWHKFSTMQNHYNLVYREEEREMIPLCQEEGIGVIPWSPLARGFLGSAPKNSSDRETLRSKTDAYGKKLYSKANDLEILDAVVRVAERHGVSPAQTALAWVMQAPGVTAPIIGTTKAEHITQAVKALDLKLSQQDISELEEPYRPHPIMGHTQPAPIRRQNA